MPAPWVFYIPIENLPSTGIAVPVTNPKLRTPGIPRSPPCRQACPSGHVQPRHLLAGTPGQIGVDPAGQHRVDLDVVLCPGSRSCARHRDDATLAGGEGDGIGRTEPDPVLIILPPPFLPSPDRR